MTGQRQYLRHAQVVVGKAGEGVLIEDLRIVFEIVKDHQGQPNSGNIKIYNLTDENQKKIKTEFDEVIVNAGYQGGEALIFRGNIRQARTYREKNDWITEIDAGDGDDDYRTGIVNETLAAGVTDQQLLSRIVTNYKTTTMGEVSGIAPTTRLRGKVISGNSRDVLANLSRQHNATWSIQDGRLTIIPVMGVLDKEAVLINERTGMIGTPEQDDKGVKVTSLLNPLYEINGRIKLDNNGIKIVPAEPVAGQKITTSKPKVLARLDPDGIYKIYKLTHKGDTRGTDWLSLCECVALGEAAPA